jgi:phage terminase large subunit-like protein
LAQFGRVVVCGLSADQVKDATNRPEAVRDVKTKNVNLRVDAERTWILLDEAWMKYTGTTNPQRSRDVTVGVVSSYQIWAI